MDEQLDVTQWLEELGLGQYAEIFAENHITPETLAELTGDDLKELGVVALGHRKTLLNAIARLAVEPAESPAPAEPAVEKPSTSANVAAAAEASSPAMPPRSFVAPSKPGLPPAPSTSPASISPPLVLPTIPATPAPKSRRGLWAAIFASKFLFVSIAAHLLFGVGATYYIVQKIQAKRKVTFQGGPPVASASKRALEHKVSMAQKKKTGGAPPQAKRIVSAGLAKVSLPEMPSLPSSNNVVPGMTAGMGGAGFGTGMGFGSGSGSGMGGAGTGTGSGFSFFGFRGGGGTGLVGTFYDLKQKRNRQPSGVNVKGYADVVKRWVNDGLRESIVDDYFKAPNKLMAAQFMIPQMDADEAPKAYGVEKEVKPAEWIAHYQGKVSPPKSGTYHFVGAADDVLIVRFNGKLVLDGSWYPPTNLKPEGIYRTGYGGHPRGGMVKGEAVHVEAGQWYELEVVIGEQPGGKFFAVLCVEEQGATYEKDKQGNPLLPLLRFSNAKPPGGKKSNFPPFEENGPIWKAQGAAAGPTSALDVFKKP